MGECFNNLLQRCRVNQQRYTMAKRNRKDRQDRQFSHNKIFCFFSPPVGFVLPESGFVFDSRIHLVFFLSQLYAMIHGHPGYNYIAMCISDSDGRFWDLSVVYRSLSIMYKYVSLAANPPSVSPDWIYHCRVSLLSSRAPCPLSQTWLWP